MIGKIARHTLVFITIGLLVNWGTQVEAKTQWPMGQSITGSSQDASSQSLQPASVPSIQPAPADLSAPPETTSQKPENQTSVPNIETQPPPPSPWLRRGNAMQRVSLGIELGGGINAPMAPPQGFFEGNLSLGLYFYDACGAKAKMSCLRFYALLPQIWAGYYFHSQFPFIQASVGLGMEVGIKPWFAWFFQSAIGGKFSLMMGSFNEQQARGIDAFSLREPTDAQILYGFFQTGASFHLAKAVDLQISAKIANGPSQVGFWRDVPDIGFFLGLRFRFQ